MSIKKSLRGCFLEEASEELQIKAHAMCDTLSDVCDDEPEQIITISAMVFEASCKNMLDTACFNDDCIELFRDLICKVYGDVEKFIDEHK